MVPMPPPGQDPAAGDPPDQNDDSDQGQPRAVDDPGTGVQQPAIANVLAAQPKSAHPGAKKALAEIWNAEDRDHARRAAAAFKLAYAAKFDKAVAKVIDDLDELLAFYDFPAVRHEAPHHRVEVRDLHRWAVAAA